MKKNLYNISFEYFDMGEYRKIFVSNVYEIQIYQYSLLYIEYGYTIPIRYDVDKIRNLKIEQRKVTVNE